MHSPAGGPSSMHPHLGGIYAHVWSVGKCQTANGLQRFLILEVQMQPMQEYDVGNELKGEANGVGMRGQPWAMHGELLSWRIAGTHSVGSTTDTNPRDSSTLTDASVQTS